MSTLTKIVIVLLTLSVIFLCGVLVTYVGNADNYKTKYEELKTEKDGLSKKVKALADQINEKTSQNRLLEEKLTGEVTMLKTQMNELQGNLKNSEREKAELLQKVNSWTSITKDFYQTTDKQGQLLKNTLEELNKIQAEQVRDRKELNEVSAALVEKMAILESLETEKKRLSEEKAELQSRLDQYLRPTGEVAAAPVPVTPKRGAAQPVVTEGKEIALNGRVTAVDSKNSMASVSVGKADGVKEGMKFHVTRGDEFICDILIIDVQAEASVGVLDLVQKQPKVGDTVSTNL